MFPQFIVCLLDICEDTDGVQLVQFPTAVLIATKVVAQTPKDIMDQASEPVITQEPFSSGTDCVGVTSILLNQAAINSSA